MTRGYVYLIRPKGHNIFKVGCSTDPQRRLITIQRKTVLELECVATLLSDDCSRAEYDWHRRLADYRLPGGGEWFALTPEAVDEFVQAGATAGLPT